MRAPHSFSFCDSVTVTSEASGMSVFLSRQTGRNQALISSCRKIVFLVRTGSYIDRAKLVYLNAMHVPGMGENLWVF